MAHKIVYDALLKKYEAEIADTGAHRYYWWDWQVVGQNRRRRVKDGYIAAGLWHECGN